jgi:hypothetical protein
MVNEPPEYAHVSRPAGAVVSWRCRRRDGAPVGGKFVHALLGGTTAWEVWKQHLRAYGHFSEFEILELKS